jgi:hypothetical protein
MNALANIMYNRVVTKVIPGCYLEHDSHDSCQVTRFRARALDSTFSVDVLHQNAEAFAEAERSLLAGLTALGWVRR